MFGIEQMNFRDFHIIWKLTRSKVRSWFSLHANSRYSRYLEIRNRVRNMLVLSVTLLSIAEFWSLRYTVCQRNHTNALEKELFLRNSEFWVRGKTSNKAVHGYCQIKANVRKFLLTGNYITDCWWWGVATNYKIFAKKQKSELKTIADYWSSTLKAKSHDS